MKAVDIYGNTGFSYPHDLRINGIPVISYLTVTPEITNTGEELRIYSAYTDSEGTMGINVKVFSSIEGLIYNNSAPSTYLNCFTIIYLQVIMHSILSIPIQMEFL